MEVTSKSQKLWKGYFRDRLFALFVIGLPFFSAPEQDLLLDSGGIIFVILIPLLIAEILELLEELDDVQNIFTNANLEKIQI